LQGVSLKRLPRIIRRWPIKEPTLLGNKIATKDMEELSSQFLEGCCSRQDIETLLKRTYLDGKPPITSFISGCILGEDYCF